MKIRCLLWAVVPAVCLAQPHEAVLRGVVTDPSGSVVQKAIIVVRQEDPTRRLEALSDERGAYEVSGLAAGSCSIATQVTGFAPYLRASVELEGGKVTTFNIRLAMGTASQSATVVSKAPKSERELETATQNHEEVLEIREVRESSSRDVGEALSRLDGLWKVRKGGIASDVVLRGFQQDNLNVLVDGVRIYGACPNNMDPPAFHVDFAEVRQVEVVKGPFDIRNQGSLGGTVNVIGKSPEPGFDLTPSLSAGSFGYWNPSIAGSLKTETIMIAGGHSYRTSQPFHDGAGRRFTELANYTAAGKEQRAFDINTSWMRAGASLFRNHQARVAYTRQRGGLVLYPYLQMDAPYDRADRASATYEIADPRGPAKRLALSGYFTRVKHWMTDEFRMTSVGAARAYGMSTQAEAKSLGGRAEADFTWGLVAGVEANRRYWNAANTLRLSGQYIDQPMIPDVTAESVGAYSQFQRAFGRGLTVTAGARLDTARSEARTGMLNTDLYWAYKGTRSVSRRDTNPSGSLWAGYKLTRSLALFSGIGYSVRQPDPQERYTALRRTGSDWIGNPDLAPTKNTEADIGLNYRSRWFTLRPTVFYSRLTDFVVVHNQMRVNPVPLVINPAARSYAGVDARIRGGELGYSLSPHGSLLLSGGFSYARGTRETNPLLRVTDRDLAEMPPLKSRASLRYGTRIFYAELENFAAAAQRKIDSDLREMETAGYTVWNAKLGIHTERVKVTLGVDNVAGRLYYEHFSHQRDPFRLASKVPEPGRNWYLTASLSF